MSYSSYWDWRRNRRSTTTTWTLKACRAWKSAISRLFQENRIEKVIWFGGWGRMSGKWGSADRRYERASCSQRTIGMKKVTYLVFRKINRSPFSISYRLHWHRSHRDPIHWSETIKRIESLGTQENRMMRVQSTWWILRHDSGMLSSNQMLCIDHLLGKIIDTRDKRYRIDLLLWCQEDEDLYVRSAIMALTY